jgi:tRNA(adenine34) deaminase
VPVALKARRIYAIIKTIEEHEKMVKNQRRSSGMEEHERFMRLALVEGEKALQAGEFPAGCIVVCENEIVAKGRRRNSSELFNETDHAEVGAVQSLVNEHPALPREKLVLYSTMEPCLMCYATLLLNGIHHIVYGYEDIMGGGTDLPLEMLKPLYQKIKVRIVPGVLRNECLSLFKQFFVNPGNIYWRESQLADYTLAQTM